MPSLMPFRKEDLHKINLRPFDEQVIMGVPKVFDLIALQAQKGIAYTGVNDEGKIIAIGGVVVLWDKVGSGWVMTSDLLLKYKTWVHRSIKEILELAIVKYNLHRTESIILKDHIVSQKWAERLGFKKEGLLKKYDSNKNDYYLYSRIT